MKNLNFYLVDMKYIRDLAKADDRVMSVSPQQQKESRPFVGVVIVCDDKEYCIPLTSPKPKHQTMNNREDFSRIVDDNGKILGALNFNNMIPISKAVITPIDIRPHPSDTPIESGRKKILNIQLDWCNKNKELISRKANKLYRLVTETPDKFRNLTRRCCDFKKLEAVLEKRLGRDTQNHAITNTSPVKGSKSKPKSVSKARTAKSDKSTAPKKKAVKTSQSVSERKPVKQVAQDKPKAQEKKSSILGDIKEIKAEQAKEPKAPKKEHSVNKTKNKDQGL